MKRLLSLALALVCLFSLCACGGESFDFKNNYEKSVYSGEPYPFDDISLNILSVDAENGALSLKVENLSDRSITYGNPFFTTAVKAEDGFMWLSHEYWQRQGLNPAYTAEAYELAPGEALETQSFVDRYLETLLPGYTYRVCFEFFYFSENSEADGNGNFKNTMHSYYLVRDFTVD